MVKKGGPACVQTENNRKMCKHIKDKDSYLIPTTPSALRIGKKSARLRIEN